MTLPSRLVASSVLLLLSVTANLQAQSRCPEGKVWGGRKCEWRNLCSDGRPARGGLCRDGRPPIPPELRQVTPRPQPRPRPRPPVVVKEITPAVSAPRACEAATVFHPKQDERPTEKHGLLGKQVQPRKVVLVGGNASELFTRYSTDAKETGRRLDLRRLEVVFFNEKNERAMLVGGDQVRMSVGQLLAGMTWEQVWMGKLGERRAFPRSDAYQQAAALEADLLCGLGRGR